MSDATAKAKFLPIWIWVLVVLELIGITGVTVVGMGDITVMHPDQSGATYLSSLYITRNLVAVLGLALAVFVFRSYIGLFIMLFSRVVTEIADFSNSYLFERSEEILATIPYLVVLMVVLPTIALVVIWPNVRQEMKSLTSR